MSSASSAQGLHCWNKMHRKGPTFFTPSCHPNHQQIKIRHQRYVFGLPPNPVTVTRFIRIPSHLKMYIHVGIPSHLIMFHTPFILLHPGCNSVDPWECHVFFVFKRLLQTSCTHGSHPDCLCWASLLLRQAWRDGPVLMMMMTR